MTRLLLIPFLIISLLGLLEAASQMAIQGGKVTMTGGYLAVGPRISTVVVSTSTTGQCMGMLCGVTYPQ